MGHAQRRRPAAGSGHGRPLSALCHVATGEMDMEIRCLQNSPSEQPQFCLGVDSTRC